MSLVGCRCFLNTELFQRQQQDAVCTSNGEMTTTGFLGSASWVAKPIAPDVYIILSGNPPLSFSYGRSNGGKDLPRRPQCSFPKYFSLCCVKVRCKIGIIIVSADFIGYYQYPGSHNGPNQVPRCNIFRTSIYTLDIHTAELLYTAFDANSCTNGLLGATMDRFNRTSS